MRSARVAEWILSLVTTQDRAASTVGDLMEGAEARGAMWFWASVAGTVCSIVWRQFCAEPGMMAWLAARGFAFTLMCALAFGLVFGIVESVGRLWLPANLVPVWSSPAYQIAGFAISLLAGRWVARRAPGRELAACCALVTLNAGIALAVDVWMLRIGGAGGGMVSTLGSGFLYLAGAIWARRKRAAIL